MGALQVCVNSDWRIRRCACSYNGDISVDMLCAGFPSGGRDACGGDSGGNIMADADVHPFALCSPVFLCCLRRAPVNDCQLYGCAI